MNRNMSICGSDCSQCYCYKSEICKGCNDCKGIVFHTNNKECLIYNCCVTKNHFKSCLECDKIPCDIWKKTRDPKFTDEEFEKNINDRINLLKERLIPNRQITDIMKINHSLKI